MAKKCTVISVGDPGSSDVLTLGPGCGMEKLWSRHGIKTPDSGRKHSGSGIWDGKKSGPGINIPDRIYKSIVVKVTLLLD
jgi:hypothetical protein